MTKRRMLENLDKADKLLRQFPNGIRVEDFGEKLGNQIDKRPYGRSTAYDYLNSLTLKGLAHYDHGMAYPEKDSTANKLVYPDYSGIEPTRALKVARIDWLLANVNWNDDESVYGNTEIEQLINKMKYGPQYGQKVKKALELIRDLLIREGKALGREKL